MRTLRTTLAFGAPAAAAFAALFLSPARATPPFFPSSGFASVDWLKVQPLAEGLRVSGQASLRNERPNVSFVWSVRVRDPRTKTFVGESRYDQQIFQLPQDTHELFPTFDDTVKLPLAPGAYKVELVIYEVPRGGVGGLSDPTVRERNLVAKRTVDVIIGG